MPLTIADATTQLNSLFDTIQSNVADKVVNTALPLIGKLSDLPDGVAAADPFGALKTQVLDAVGAATGADVAQAIVDAITALGLEGVSAVKTVSGGVDITFATERQFDTGTAQLDIGGSVGGFLDLEVDTGATLTAALNATISFSADGEVSLKDQATPELAVKVAADLSIANLNADLGVANVTFNDADPTKPEFQSEFGFDLALPAGGAFSVTPTLTASAGLDLSFATTDALADLLPGMRGNLVVDYAVSGTTFGTPTIEVKNLKVDLGSYLGIVGDVFGGVADDVFGGITKVFNTEGLGTIVDIATEPVPALNDLAHTFGIVNVFDKVGGLTGGGDGVITIGDLAAFQSKQVEDILDPWYQAIDLVSKIRKIDALSGAGEIDFGGGSLVGGTTVPDNDPAAIVAALKTELGKLGLPQEVTDFLGDVEIGGVAGAAAAPSKGFTFGLFENPGDILKILLTNQPVDLVKFDVPPLEFDQAAGGFFPVLGPLGFLLEGRLRAGVDVDVGYDTQGLIDNNFANGFFVTTEAAATPVATTWENPRQLAFLPVGALDTSISGGAGVGFAGSSITVNARFGFGLYAYFEAADQDGKFRPGADDFDCIFDPVGGQAGVSLNVTIKIGFGPFSIKKNIPLAEATLADFEVFKCPPPSVEATPLAPGLATAIAADLFLNVGEPVRANQRLIVDEHDGVAKPVGAESLNESYVIGLARDQSDEDINPADNPPPVLVPGKLDVYAFGFTQRVDVPTFIRADFKGGDDMLVIQSDVTVDSVVSGGGGSDTLIGGGGRDTLRGDANDDVLSGNDGDDDLSGGTGDDQLSGGKGADRMDGGDNIDTVDYSRANQDTRRGVLVTITTSGDVIGHGGEAEGDRLISIESLVGTDFADDFRAGFGVTQNVVFDGGRGSDILIGGKGGDLLLGGQGADHLNGDAGVDGTSYVTSWGAVDIDLQRTIQRGGDAQGDRLFGIEAVEGSINSDTLLGNAGANILVGNDGNDVLEGRGGADLVVGDFGSDLIYGGADGDTLDGGAGVDTLSYQHVSGPVTVDLGATQQRVLGLTVFVPGSAPDNIVMAQPFEDDVRGRSSFENLIGTGGGDTLTGDIGYNRIEGRDGNDVINGDDGFDILVGGFGADQLSGGRGLDWVYYDDSPSGVVVDLLGVGAGGTAQGDTFATVENILGSTAADTLRGDGSDNIIDPNISGAAVTESVDGRGGTDTLRVNYSTVQADIGQGVVGGFDLGETTLGSFQRLTGSGAALDTVDFQGIQRLELVGTRSADTIYAGSGDDRIVAGDGADFVLSGVGSDNVFAGDGDDFVAIGTDANRILSTAGGAGVFAASGGAGIDTYSISLAGRSESIVLLGIEPTGSEFTGVNLSLPDGSAISEFEILQDAMTGSGDDFIFQPGDVDNSIVTGEGSDIIVGSLGTDFVSGGRDADNNLALFQGELYLTNEAQFFSKQGDVLIVNYSDLADGQQVVSSAERYETDINLKRTVHVGGEIGSEEERLFAVNSTMGSYRVIDSSGTVFDRTDFSDIERIIATGSDSDDILVGTYSQIKDVDIPSTLRGDDDLTGGDGNDTLFGITGSDRLHGGAGNDMLFGTSFQSFDQNFGDQTEIDTLFGGTGADTFVLGTSSQRLYQSGDSQAIIMDFSRAEGDKIQLRALTAEETADTNGYIYEQTGSTVVIKYGFVNNPAFRDVVAEIRNYVGTFDANLDVSFVAPSSGFAAFAASASANAFDAFADNPSYVRSTQALSPQSTSTASENDGNGGSLIAAGLSAPLAATANGFTVARENDPGVLKAVLDGATGGAGSTLSLNGSADAFGTFDGDPFGLGRGIILSTGRVEDLPGENTSESGGSNVTSVPITFEKIGRAGQSDIFRADLSNLGTDIRSLTIADGNTQMGGAGGIASGFDLDAVALSRTRLDDASGLNLNDPSMLQRLDVFDFSAASLRFTPGTQRPPSSFPNGPTLDGAANVTLVDNVKSTLGRFSFGPDGGSLTLGDGGSLGLQLTQPVSTDAPLYLYIGEEGLTGETVVGHIEVSPDFLEPTGDLSTDLGAEGPDGDTTSLTYSFTPKAGDTGFSLDVVLFSEELPEFDGTDLTDLFSIRLNGREIGALSNGAALTIKNLVYAASGDLVLNPVGTGPLADVIKADAFTKTLTISGVVDPGVVNTLTIEVKDGRDAFLDSGLLIKDGSFKTFTRPELSAVRGGDGTLVIGGDCVMVTVSLPNGITLTKPVDVVVTPTETIDLGAGPGQPVVITFNPGDATLSKEICVQAIPGADPNQPATITYTVTSDDPAIGGQGLAPEVFDLMRGILDQPSERQAFWQFQVAADALFDQGSALITYTATLGNGDPLPDWFTFDAGTRTFSGTPPREGDLNQRIQVRVTANDGVASVSDTFDLNLIGDNPNQDPDGFVFAPLQTQGADTYVASNRGELINALGGADVVTGALGNDTINGDAGNDRIDGGGGQNALHGNDGDDYIAAISNLNVAHGDAGADQLYFNGNQNQLFGAEGNDWLGLNGINNALVGGAGDDPWIGASGGSNTLDGQAGDDRLFAIDTNNHLHGGDGNDWLGVSGISNQLFGGDGHDWLGTSGGNNVLDGGFGNDTLVAGSGSLGTTFVFHAGYGIDEAIGFDPARGHVVDMETFGLADFGALRPFMGQVGSDVVITINAATIFTLRDVNLSALGAAQFDLV